MSYFLNSCQIYGASAQLTAIDRSWCRKANRIDFSMNPFHDTGTAPKRLRYRGRKGIWPSSKMMGGDPSVEGYSHLGNDCQGFGRFGEYNIEGKGGGGGKFIIGQVKTDAGSPISGALIKCFLTSTDVIVSTVYSDSNGYYMAPTPYTGLAHYILAYLDAATDRAGASVNTLIPTNVDGT